MSGATVVTSVSGDYVYLAASGGPGITAGSGSLQSGAVPLHVYTISGSVVSVQLTSISGVVGYTTTSGFQIASIGPYRQNIDVLMQTMARGFTIGDGQNLAGLDGLPPAFVTQNGDRVIVVNVPHIVDDAGLYKRLRTVASMDPTQPFSGNQLAVGMVSGRNTVSVSGQVVYLAASGGPGITAGSGSLQSGAVPLHVLIISGSVVGSTSVSVSSGLAVLISGQAVTTLVSGQPVSVSGQAVYIASGQGWVQPVGQFIGGNLIVKNSGVWMGTDKYHRLLQSPLPYGDFEEKPSLFVDDTAPLYWGSFGTGVGGATSGIGVANPDQAGYFNMAGHQADRDVAASSGVYENQSGAVLPPGTNMFAHQHLRWGEWLVQGIFPNPLPELGGISGAKFTMGLDEQFVSFLTSRRRFARFDIDQTRASGSRVRAFLEVDGQQQILNIETGWPNDSSSGVHTYGIQLHQDLARFYIDNATPASFVRNEFFDLPVLPPGDGTVSPLIQNLGVSGQIMNSIWVLRIPQERTAQRRGVQPTTIGSSGTIWHDGTCVVDYITLMNVSGTGPVSVSISDQSTVAGSGIVYWRDSIPLQATRKVDFDGIGFKFGVVVKADQAFAVLAHGKIAA